LLFLNGYDQRTFVRCSGSSQDWIMATAKPSGLTEQELYALELRLIKKYFRGLKPRPVKIDNTIADYAQAAEPFMIFNVNLHNSKQEVRETLLHELIHYELADGGRGYAGHGSAFLQRAKSLGILGHSELFQCSQLEEAERIPHTTESIRVTLSDAAKNIDREISELIEFVIKRTAMNVRSQIYQKLRNIEVRWTVYHRTIEQGKDYIINEVWKRRRGPRGKARHELLTEFRVLDEQVQKLQEKYFATHDKTVLRDMQRLERKKDRLQEKLSRDYGIDAY
jgi:hypothetical protein